jgi:hypothetical protein
MKRDGTVCVDQVVKERIFLVVDGWQEVVVQVVRRRPVVGHDEVGQTQLTGQLVQQVVAVVQHGSAGTNWK